MNHCSKKPNSPSRNFLKLIALVIISMLALSTKSVIDPQLKLQSEIVTIYNNPSTPTRIEQNISFPFVRTYSTTPLCIYSFSQQISQYNVTEGVGNLYYKTRSRSDIYRFQLEIDYDEFKDSLLAKVITVKYLCFQNYYSNVVRIAGSFGSYESYGTALSQRTLTSDISLSQYSYTPSSDLKRNVPVYTLTEYWLQGVNNYGFGYSLNVFPKNSTHLRFQFELTTKATVWGFMLQIFLFNLDGFPGGNTLIGFEKLELTPPFTSLNNIQLNGLDYVFVYTAQAKSDMTDFDIRFDNNPSKGTIDFMIGGLDSLTVGVFIFANDAQYRVKRFVNKHCGSKDVNNVCTVCSAGYELDSNAICISTIKYCITNKAQNFLLCDVCRAGYTLSADQLSCDPKVKKYEVIKSSTKYLTYQTYVGSGFGTGSNFGLTISDFEASELPIIQIVIGVSIFVVVAIAIVALKSYFCGPVRKKKEKAFNKDFIDSRKEFLKRQQKEIKRLAIEKNISIEQVEEEKKQLLQQKYKDFSNVISF